MEWVGDTPDGKIAIEDLEVGDWVWAHDFNSDQHVARRIEHLIPAKTKAWIHLHTDAGEIVATPGHDFWVVTQERWIDAQDLLPEMGLLRSDGKITYIISLDLETLEVEEPTYNFEVEQDHDYYVGDSGVLVHNVGCSFENQFPHLLVGEIADAETAGIVPIRAVAPGFEQMVNQGTIKWVLTEKNELIVAPAMTNGFEISHAVLSKGRPVLSAGQADIAVVGKARVAAGITNKSGHFKPSKESLKLGIEAFRRKGISKPTLGLV